MGDLLEKAAAWLNEQRRKHLTRLIKYQRGTSQVELQATVGRTVFRLEQGYGLVTHQVSRDFLVSAADLVLDGETVLPERGDRIIETSEGVEYEHEVLAPGNEPEWRYSDPRRTTLRIHTKEVRKSPL